MNKNLLIIHTRNNSLLIKELLKNLISVFGNTIPLIIIIDDSTKGTHINEVFDYISKLDNIIIHINKDNWAKFKNYIFNHSREYRKIQFLKQLDLGKKNWNTPIARNIAFIIATLFTKEKENKILFIDDDIRLTEKVNLNEIYLKNKVGGFLLSSCPDLSRLEWINLFLLTEQYSKKNKQRSYVFKLFKKIGLKQSRFLLGKYMEIIDKKIKDNFYLDSNFRGELHGGAFLIEKRLIKECMFIPCFDEDWYWFQKITSRNFKNRILKAGFLHASRKKIVLDKKTLLNEEFGKIIVYLQRGKKYYYIPSKKIIQEEIYRRIDIISKIVAGFKSIKNKKKKLKVKMIINYLEELIRFLNKINYKDIKKIIIQQNINNKRWKIFIKTLEKEQFDELFLFFKPNRQIISFSPHSDDLVFCLGGFISSYKGIIKENHNFFTLTNYKINSLGNISSITKLRKAEERASMNSLNIKPFFYDFKDAVIRIGKKETDYLSNELNSIVDIKYKSIDKLIKRISKKNSNAIFALPLGIGGHVDHRIIFKSSLWALKHKKSSILFYEDTPYDLTKNKSHVKKYLKKIPFKLKKLVINSNLNKKIKQVIFYKSQVDKKELRRIKNIFSLKNGETIYGDTNLIKEILKLI